MVYCEFKILQVSRSPRPPHCHIACFLGFVSDIAVFVLKRDIKLQPTNLASWVCMFGHIHDVIICSKFHGNPFWGFMLPSSFYDCLYGSTNWFYISFRNWKLRQRRTWKLASGQSNTTYGHIATADAHVMSYNGRPFPPKLPLSMEDLDPHLTHDFMSPSESTTQTTSQSVQPFLHRHADTMRSHSVRILYNGMPLPSPLKIARSHGGLEPI